VVLVVAPVARPVVRADLVVVEQEQQHQQVPLELRVKEMLELAVCQTVQPTPPVVVVVVQVVLELLEHLASEVMAELELYQ
jgi:hypothetical protein